MSFLKRYCWLGVQDSSLRQEIVCWEVCLTVCQTWKNSLLQFPESFLHRIAAKRAHHITGMLHSCPELRLQLSPLKAASQSQWQLATMTCQYRKVLVGNPVVSNATVSKGRANPGRMPTDKQLTSAWFDRNSIITVRPWTWIGTF